MASIQASVDLNDVVRRLWHVSIDVAEFGDEGSQLCDRIRRELGRAEHLSRLLKQEPLLNGKVVLDVVGDIQRRAFVELLSSVEAQLSRLEKDISDGLQLPGLLPTSSLSPNNTPAGKPTLKSRLSWGLGGKRKAERSLGHVKALNDYLKGDIEDVIRTYTRDAAPSTALTIENNAEAKATGVSTTVNLLRVKRGQTVPLANLLLSSEDLSIKAGEAAAEPADGGTDRLVYGTLRGAMGVLLEYRHVSEWTDDGCTRALKLATFLSQPQLEYAAVLPCRGVRPNREKRRFEYAFDASQLMSSAGPGAESRPKLHSLASQLEPGREGIFRYSKLRSRPAANARRPLSVTQRLIFAHSIAHTVSCLHMVDWLHQSINSHNIFFLKFDSEKPPGPDILLSSTPGVPYLFGFQQARHLAEYSDQAVLARFSDDGSGLYRHPDRQMRAGGSPSVPHSKIHDIYSLGVVLLEVGLGRLAVEIVREGMSKFPVTQAWPVTPENIKSFLIFLTENLLPEKMGDKYATITRTCLAGNVQEMMAEETGEVDVSVERAFRHFVVGQLSLLAGTV